MTIGELARQKVFWVFLLMMLCAGAGEQGVSLECHVERPS